MSDDELMNFSDIAWLADADHLIRLALDVCDQSNGRERTLVDDFRRLLLDLDESAKAYGADKDGNCTPPPNLEHLYKNGMSWVLNVKSKSEINKKGYIAECAHQFRYKNALRAVNDKSLYQTEESRRAIRAMMDNDVDYFHHLFPGAVTSDELEMLNGFVRLTIVSSLDSSNPGEKELLDQIMNEEKKQANSSPQAESKGCYVATCVYGSYDCPEVWVLRRFRDQALSEVWSGRQFIRLYYAISPSFVRRFGRVVWLRSILKAVLDRLVKACKKRGYSDMPYAD